MFPLSGQVFIKILNKHFFFTWNVLIKYKSRNALWNKYKINKINENTKIVTQVKAAEFPYYGMWKQVISILISIKTIKIYFIKYTILNVYFWSWLCNQQNIELSYYTRKNVLGSRDQNYCRSKHMHTYTHIYTHKMNTQ